MKIDDIYEVSRDEYVGFLNQIRPSARATKTLEEKNYTILNSYSIKNNNHLCTRMIPKNEDEIEKYYVINMPDDDERQAPKAVRKIVLESKEEVQTFFDILSKLQKGEESNG